MKTYKQLKELGNVTLSDVQTDAEKGDFIEVTIKAFDPQTGEETKPEVATYGKKQLIQEKQKLEFSLTNVTELLEEFQK